MSRELLTVEEAAERLKMNPQTVRRWIRQGLLPAAKIGRKEWRIDEADLLPALARPSATELARRGQAVDRLLALRDRLQAGKTAVSLAELMAESRRELERRDETRGH